MLKISVASSLALHIMAILSSNTDRLIKSKEMAGSLKVSENHLSKILQRLAKLRLVKSIRGPKGGFRLGRDPDSITLIEIYEGIEGPFNSSMCLLEQKSCSGDKCLILNGLCNKINALFNEYMSGTHLSDLGDFKLLKR